LHHFLDEKDLIWLQNFSHLELSDGQKQALIFVREVGAIDNQTYRQMTDCDTLKASNELRVLKSYNLLLPKGKGKATYYIAGKTINISVKNLSTPPHDLSTPPHDLSTPPQEISTPPQEIRTPPIEILNRIEQIKDREHDTEKIKGIIVDLCTFKTMKAIEIAKYLNKGDDYLKRKYLSDMIKDKQLFYLYPEMINHPEQAYKIQEIN
jgi:ATP-dependent DNA helicase RecG